MATWTAEVVSVGVDPENKARVRAIVRYTSDAGEVVDAPPIHGDDLGVAVLKEIVAKRIYSLGLRDSKLDPQGGDTVKVGKVLDLPTWPPASDPEADAFFAALDTLRKLQQAVAYGLIAPDDADLATAQLDAAEKFKVNKPAYVTDLRWR